MKKLRALLSLFICIFMIILCTSCATKENKFYDVYMSSAYETLGNSEIESIIIYKDDAGGELAVFDVKVQNEKGYSTSETYKLVLSQIKFDASKVELKSFEEDLYSEAVSDADGEIVEKGYFVEQDELSKETGILALWQLKIAETDFDAKYDIDKINDLINKK